MGFGNGSLTSTSKGDDKLDHVLQVEGGGGVGISGEFQGFLRKAVG